MNMDSVTTLQKGGRRNVSPVHIHLTDATPFHVHLKKPIKPKPVYPKTVTKSTSNPKSVANKNNSNNPRDFSARFGNRKGTPEEFDFGRSYGSESDEKPDGMEYPASQKLLREREGMLDEYRRKLSESEKENKKLVKDMEEICLGLEGRSDFSFMDPDLNRLTNSQHFLQAMAIKMDDFGTMIRHLREDRIPCISNAELEAILTQKKILERDLVTFDDVCIFLRREMRRTIEGKSKVREMLREREEMMARLENFRESYEALKKNLVETENRAEEAFSELESHRTGQTQSNTIIETLRMTKAHLQRELSAREAECNKLSVKVRDLQDKLDREKQAREKIDQDKESLKKATRLHKTKASQKAESLEQINKLLISKEAEVSDLTQQLTSLKLQLSQVATEKIALAAELNEAKLKLIPPSKSTTKQRTRKLPSEEEGDDDDEVTSGDDDDDSGQSNRLKKTKKILKRRERTEDDSTMKTSLAEAESKVSHFKSETSQLRMKVQEFENLIEEYKDQVTLSRQEAEMYRSQVEDLRKELSRGRFEKDFKSAGSRQPETTNDLGPGRILNENNSSNIFGSGKILSDRIELLDKRILSLEDENKELAVLNGKREEALHQTNLRLEEKISENSALQRQFDTLMADVRRMKDSEKDRIAAAERSNQVHILELEGQINQLKHDIEKLKREKDEIERRLHQKMYDLQDELKQSHSTNRALQNFIHFLKSSYNATFDQPSLATFSSIPNLASLGR